MEGPQVPIASLPTYQSKYKSLASSEDIDALQERQEQQQQHQQVQQQIQKQLQQQGRYTGSTSVFVSSDNRFKFVVDAKITAPVKFEELQNVKPNEKVPATQFNFFFVRHAKSCANEQMGLSGHLKKLKLDDPFISNDGIFATIAKQNDYREFFKQYDVDHYFCSPLIRTWCTAAMLFPNHISDFEIAPHLRENASGYVNHPYPYETNVQRFGFFSKYVKTLTDGSMTIDGVPGYALMNKAFADYGSDFVDQIGIELFMQWYIKNENILGRTNSSTRNVVVVCHSDILKTFCKAHLNESQLMARGMGGDDAFFKHTNNYCIQVQVVMPVRQSKPVQYAFGTVPLTTSEKDEVKNIVAKNLAQRAAETEAWNAKLTQPELTQAEAELRKLREANAALGANNEPILTQDVLNANDEKIKQLEIAIAHMKERVNSPVAGGNKRKKTKRVKRTKSSKRKNKKTRVVKQRGGGGNKYFDAMEKNLPFHMTITKAIDGTKDIVRDPRAKKLDCICEPDSYQDPVKTFECAKQGKDDSRGFAFRQNPKNEDEMNINKAITDKLYTKYIETGELSESWRNPVQNSPANAAQINANAAEALKSRVLQQLTQAT